MTPPGLRITRWYCPEGHRTFSLLPDFLAARLPGLLVAIEDSVNAAALSRSVEAAADTLRGLEVTLPSAVRWLRRRVNAVRTALDVVSRLAPEIGAPELGVDRLSHPAAGHSRPRPEADFRRPGTCCRFAVFAYYVASRSEN